MRKGLKTEKMVKFKKQKKMGVWEPLIFYDMKKTDDIRKVVVMSFCLLKIDTSLTKKTDLNI